MSVLELWLYGVIGDEIRATALQKKLAASDAETVLIHLNSDGGDLVEGNVIHNMLARHNARIEVEIDGLAASAASLIAMAGDEIRIAENAMMMIHEPWGASEGSAQDHEALAAVLKKHTAQMADTYAKRSGQEPDAIASMMAAETWMTAAEAIAAGFADKLIASSKVAARVRNAKRFKKLPKRLRASDGLSLNEKTTAIGAALRDMYPSDDAMMCAGPYVCDVFDATVVYEYDGKLYEAPYSMAGSTVTLGKAAEVKRTYAPLAAPVAAKTKRKPRGESTMDPKLITEALDALEAGDSAKALEILKALIASAAGGAPADDPAADPAMAAGMDPEKEKEMVAALAKLAACAKVNAEARKLTGETKPESVIAALTALKSGAGEAGKLAIRLSALEADATKREVDELIKANTKKIPPTLDAWARTQSPEALQAFLKQAPDVVASPASPEVNAPQISERAKALCEKNKIDPKKFADFRAQMRRGQE